MEDLLAMGFPENEARTALERCGNNVEAALDCLLSGASASPPGPSSSNAEHSYSSDESDQQLVVLPISQYSFPESGSSACTVIAASMLDFLLRALKDGVDPHMLSADELVQVVRRGVDKFSRLPRSQSAVEHLAVDELGADFFSNILPVEGGMVQGLLTNAASFDEAIETAQRLGRSDAYVGMVLTKPPETVCLIVPPATAERRTYIFFDSHSRPQDGIDGACLLIASDPRVIVQRLKRIFPVFPCDDFDDGGYMSMMYNMFEGTLFQCKF